MVGLFARVEPGAQPFVVFDILQLLALVLLAAMLMPTMLSQSVHRMKTWFNLIVACIVYCISFLLLLGHQSPSGPDPPFALCVVQSGLIYAAPATVAAAGFAFVIELYLRLSSTLAVTEVKGRRITVLLFISPLAHLFVFWVALIASRVSRPTIVADVECFRLDCPTPRTTITPPIIQRDVSGLYCNIKSNTPTTVTGVTVIIFISMMIIMEVYTVIYLVRKRSAVRCIKLSSGIFPLPLFIRTASYTLAGGLGIILVDILMNSKASKSGSKFVVLDLMAIIPLSIALVSGSQMDILSVYMCCKKKRPSQNFGKV